MTERSGENESTDASQEVGRTENESTRRGSRRRDEEASTTGESTPGAAATVMTSPEIAAIDPSPVPGRQVMTGLSIKELEMLPRLEQIAQMEEIQVGGVTHIDPDVIGAIAGIAVQSVAGVASLGATSFRRSISERIGSTERKGRGVGVEVGRREAILDINFRVIYGYSIPNTVVEVRQKVADSLVRLTGLITKEINIHVIGIDFPSRMPGRVE